MLYEVITDDVFDMAYTLGAYAVYISGAGPTIMAIVDHDNEFFEGKMRFSLENKGLSNWIVKGLEIDNKGTIII